ncbi:MAG TPA: hypothetical protein VFI20_00755, partial [Terracidiphilus sp.]|nr:hypothetical protein [Terracidiphilus sp.]
PVWLERVPTPLRDQVTPALLVSLATAAVSVTELVASTVVADALTVTLTAVDDPPEDDPPHPDTSNASEIVIDVMKINAQRLNPESDTRLQDTIASTVTAGNPATCELRLREN